MSPTLIYLLANGALKLFLLRVRLDVVFEITFAFDHLPTDLASEFLHYTHDVSFHVSDQVTLPFNHLHFKGENKVNKCGR